MAQPTQKIPGPDHPITVEVNPARVLVKLGDTVIADTTRAQVLRESTYPAVQYIPREEVDFAALARTEHHTYCPYKGNASYYSLTPAGSAGDKSGWTLAASTDGRFSKRLPLLFNEFTVVEADPKAHAARTFTVGARDLAAGSCPVRSGVAQLGPGSGSDRR